MGGSYSAAANLLRKIRTRQDAFTWGLSDRMLLLIEALEMINCSVRSIISLGYTGYCRRIFSVLFPRKKASPFMRFSMKGIFLQCAPFSVSRKCNATLKSFMSFRKRNKEMRLHQQTKSAPVLTSFLLMTTMTTTMTGEMKYFYSFTVIRHTCARTTSEQTGGDSWLFTYVFSFGDRCAALDGWMRGTRFRRDEREEFRGTAPDRTCMADIGVFRYMWTRWLISKP